MDFKNTKFKTKFCTYLPVDQNDIKSIIDIRSGRDDSVLKKIKLSVSAQKKYLQSYNKRFLNKQEIYYKISLLSNESPLGLVRLTELNEDYRFNYQSLIFKKNIPAFMPIDTIFTMYELGFINLKKEVCGPWVVPKTAKKIYQIHKKMGLATEIMSNKELYFFIVTKDKFFTKKDYFKKLGFGLE